ncbi:MAG: hypothetical protein ACP5N7_05330 [Candidatus Pacearchaeota archaeon]
MSANKLRKTKVEEPEENDGSDSDQYEYEIKRVKSTVDTSRRSNKAKPGPVINLNAGNGRRLKKVKEVKEEVEEDENEDKHTNNQGERLDKTNKKNEVKQKGRKKKEKKPVGLWITTLKENGYLLKGSEFKAPPKKDTPEYKKIREIFDEKKIQLAKSKPI